LLYSCLNIKNNIVYLKYPYVMYDLLIPVSWYFFFINPFNWKWQISLGFFYSTMAFAWIPHVTYLQGLNKKIHKLHLLRGGKYLKVT